jgi:hypothetical protein
MAVSGEELDIRSLREIGDLAVWSLSSCKQGFGIDQLRDGLTTTYWQSVCSIIFLIEDPMAHNHT